MAIVTWISTVAGNFTTAANWSTGIVPDTGDDVVFNGSANGNCTYTVPAGTPTFKSLTTTGYSGSLIFNGQFPCYTDITLGSTTTIASNTLSTPHIRMQYAALTGATTSLNLTTNGVALNCNVQLSIIGNVSVPFTVSLGSDCTCTKIFQVQASPLSSITLRSNIPNTQRAFTLSNVAGASSDIDYLNVIDLNSSGGKTLYTYAGTITNSTNWYQISPQPLATSHIFV